MTDRLPEWMRDMTRCVDDKLMKQLCEDFRTYSVSLPLPKDQAAAQEVRARTNGWVTAPQLKQPDGVRIVDELCDQADAADRAAWKWRGGPV